MEPISTDIFKIKGGTISRTMMTLYGKSWILWTLTIMLPFIVAGIIFDLRWVIIALMLLFIIMPMMLAALYFYYGMNRISVINSTYHKFEFSSKSIRAYIYSKELPTQIQASTSTDTVISDEDKPDYTLRSQIDIPYSIIKDFVVGMQEVILRTNLNGRGFLLLPLSSFQDKQIFAKTLEIVTTEKKMNKKETRYLNTERK